MNDVTTLPISPQSFWMSVALLGFLAVSVLIYGALSGLGKDHRPALWEQVSDRWLLPTILMGLLWLGLFFLTIAAAYVGVWQAIQPKGQAVQPGLGLGALLAALLGAPFVIWGTWLKYQTVRYQKEGHITDRINKAVEQLGAEKTVKVRAKDDDGKDITIEETRPNIEVRIGAILSLERIAQDSTIHDKGRDHVRVMEILCAYVRENSNARKPEEFPEPEWKPRPIYSDESDLFHYETSSRQQMRKTRFGDGGSTSKAWKWAQHLSEPSADVVQALLVMGRRTAEQRQVEAAWPNMPEASTVWPFDLPYPQFPEGPEEVPANLLKLEEYKEKVRKWNLSIRLYSGYRLELQRSNLQGADLSPKRDDATDSVFSGAILTEARLEGANLSRTRIVGTRMSNAKLLGADLSYAKAEGVDLQGALMEGSEIYEASLQSGTFMHAKIDGSNAAGVKLDGAILADAQLEGAYLGNARIRMADLTRSSLEGASLAFARAELSSFRSANMKWTSLLRTLMNGADLSEANLDGAFLEQTDLHGTRLSGARMKYSLIWGARLEAASDTVGLVLSGAAAHDVSLESLNPAEQRYSEMFADASVTLPFGVMRPDHWPTWELQWHGENGFRSEVNKWRADPAGYVPPLPPARQ